MRFKVYSAKYKTIILDIIRSIFRIRFFENLLVEYTQGKDVNSLIQKFTPNNYSYKKSSIREVVRDGIRYNLDIHDMVDWYIYYGFNNPCGSDMFSHMNLKDNIIDIGGNNGEVALKAAKKVGIEGRVISFEPLLLNIDRFKKNLSLNPSIDNITLINKGVGNQEGEFTIVNDRDDNLGMGWIEENNISNDIDTYYSQKVLVTTLDKYLPTMKLSHIDFIKIDVEGFELKVLIGADSVINKYRPTLFIEVVDSHLKKQSTSAVELIKYLQSKKYSIKNSGTGEMVDLDTNFNYMMDILAIPNIKQD